MEKEKVSLLDKLQCSVSAHITCKSSHNYIAGK